MLRVWLCGGGLVRVYACAVSWAWLVGRRRATLFGACPPFVTWSAACASHVCCAGVRVFLLALGQ
jgi:hypothetical protein